jgi:hypothetical protein
MQAIELYEIGCQYWMAPRPSGLAQPELDADSGQVLMVAYAVTDRDACPGLPLRRWSFGGRVCGQGLAKPAAVSTFWPASLVNQAAVQQP